MARQFVIQMQNRPGELAHVARSLAARGIDIHNVACIGHGPLACMVMATSDHEATRHVLHGLGYPYVEGEPIFVDVEDRPGGLAEVTERLAAAHVNITGALAVGRRQGTLEMAFCVDDEPTARRILEGVEEEEEAREKAREDLVGAAG